MMFRSAIMGAVKLDQSALFGTLLTPVAIHRPCWPGATLWIMGTIRSDSRIYAESQRHPGCWQNRDAPLNPATQRPSTPSIYF